LKNEDGDRTAADTAAAVAPESVGVRRGPLVGLRVLEFASLGPAPFAAMLLSDLGADVVRIERPGPRGGGWSDPVGRGRTVVQIDLKQPGVLTTVLELAAATDVLIEGFRPGVMERLGLGPDELTRRNPTLIYGRATGWGQSGPLAHAAGHDLNYIAITGALNAIGYPDTPPVPPLNVVGDYAGGSLYLIVGLLAALFESRRSGRGQVIDAAICDGTVSLLSALMGFTARGLHSERRGENVLDGGAPYYNIYRTRDERYVSIAAIEPQFFDQLCERLDVPQELRAAQHDRQRWPELRAAFVRIFSERTQAQWSAELAGSDVCFAPVMTLAEAPTHPHLAARESFVTCGEVWQAAAAPRFSRTPGAIQGMSPVRPAEVEGVLARWRGTKCGQSSGGGDAGPSP
jgi:alpha-methylacyl-CoA racemase